MIEARGLDWSLIANAGGESMPSPAQHGDYSSLGDKAPLSPARPTVQLALAPPPEQLCPQGVLSSPPILIYQTSTTEMFIHRDFKVRGGGGLEWVNLKTLYLVLSRHFGSSIKKAKRNRPL